MKTQCTNTSLISGFVGKEVKLKTVKPKKEEDDVPVCTFNVGIPYTDEQTENTQWHTFQVEAWRGLATIAKERLAKGHKVLVEGSLRVDKWTDGDDNPRSRTYIRAERIEFLTRKQ